MDNSRIHNNVVINEGFTVIIRDKTVLVNGEEFPLPKGKCTVSTVIDKHVYIDGYELIKGKWKKTPRAIFHKYF